MFKVTQVTIGAIYGQIAPGYPKIWTPLTFGPISRLGPWRSPIAENLAIISLPIFKILRVGKIFKALSLKIHLRDPVIQLFPVRPMQAMLWQHFRAIVLANFTEWVCRV